MPAVQDPAKEQSEGFGVTAERSAQTATVGEYLAYRDFVIDFIEEDS
jgi:hypothetical protein